MERSIIHTEHAPAAIGPYSQAVRCGNTVYLSGQLPICPQTKRPVNDTVEAEIHQVFRNLRAVAEAAGGDLSRMVKLNAYLTDLADSPTLNAIMGEYFTAPYPARAAVRVAGLPQGLRIEVEGILLLD
ncbi:RidA family protein [Dyella soli]|uniref:RidA family protein n=1 Tax=Dyella soli TaxID=522319 RepID=A0A4R0YMS1_9GAMM|nr:RidA family protein [Dyella soli]TCI10187.1 RidA family protein [Dyella soli]